MKTELMLLRTRQARRRLTRAVLVLLAKQAGGDVQEIEGPPGGSMEIALMYELEALATAAEKAAGIDIQEVARAGLLVKGATMQRLDEIAAGDKVPADVEEETGAGAKVEKEKAPAPKKRARTRKK
jgi:hypothetical protein